MKPRISIIAALDSKRGIGKDNKVPWYIKADLVRLKKLTIGHVTILGRNTFESMLKYYEKSGRPTMMQRTHIVLTKDKDYVIDSKYGFVSHSVEEAIAKAREREPEEVFIIGGAQIFAQALPMVDRLYITIVEGEYEADTFFPDYSEFKKVISEEEKQEEDLKYKYTTLER